MLITGANGFIGRALCAELERRGRPFRAASRRPAPGCIAVGGVDADTDWSTALAGVGCVVHLAARVHVTDPAESRDELAFHRVNAEGTATLARQAAAAGVRRFVLISTIGVNGNTTDGRPPMRGDDAPAPHNGYARSKLAAERELTAIAGAGGMEAVIVRPPLVYGPGAKANFGTLTRLVARGAPLPLASARNRRSLVSLNNLVDFIIVAADHPQAAGGVFLASDGEDVSTPDLIRAMARAMGRPARLFPMPPALLRTAATMVGRRRIADQLLGSLEIDLGPTRERLGWTPPLTLSEGLSAMAPAWDAGDAEPARN